VKPLVAGLRKATPSVCRRWLVLIYIAVVVSIILALAIHEALS
jgi:hypothetical protein